MPVYNSEKYIKKSIQSIKNQTLKEIELICIDDCSTDNSLKVIKDFQEKDERIKRLNNKQNKGPGESRNRGIEKAKGEFILFVDSDDWLEKEACEILYKKAKEENSDVVYIKPKLVFANKVIKDKRLLTNKDLLSKENILKKNLKERKT